MAKTHILHGIYFHEDAEEPLPTRPALGANYSQSDLNNADWVTIGSRDQQSHDADLDEDTLTPTIQHNTELIQPPRGQAPDDAVMLQIFANEFEFTCYDFSETLWTLTSTASLSSSGVMNFSEANLAPRACIAEIRNYAIFYFPKVYLYPGDTTMGAASGGVTRQAYRVLPLRTDTIPAGVRIYFKQPAP